MPVSWYRMNDDAESFNAWFNECKTLMTLARNGLPHSFLFNLTVESPTII